jgi:hypothetical protein
VAFLSPAPRATRVRRSSAARPPLVRRSPATRATRVHQKLKRHGPLRGPCRFSFFFFSLLPTLSVPAPFFSSLHIFHISPPARISARPYPFVHLIICTPFPLRHLPLFFAIPNHPKSLLTPVHSSSITHYGIAVCARQSGPSPALLTSVFFFLEVHTPLDNWPAEHVLWPPDALMP